MTEDVMGVPVAYRARSYSRDDWSFGKTESLACEAACWNNEETTRDIEPLYTAAQARALADAEVARERDACAAKVPTNWCDPLLTGDRAALPRTGEITPRHIEALLRGIQDAIRARGQGGGNERS